MMKAKLHNGMILCECGRALFLCWRGTQATSLRCLNGDCPHAGQRFRPPELEINLFPLPPEQVAEPGVQPSKPENVARLQLVRVPSVPAKILALAGLNWSKQ